ASTNSSLVDAAAAAIGRLTNRADDAIVPLRKLMTSTNEYTRLRAMMALWRLGADAEETRQLLEPLLANNECKAEAARCLGTLGKVALPSVPALLKASHEDIGAWIDIYDRYICAAVALRIGGESAEAIGVMEEALAFPKNAGVRDSVA